MSKAASAPITAARALSRHNPFRLMATSCVAARAGARRYGDIEASMGPKVDTILTAIPARRAAA